MRKKSVIKCWSYTCSHNNNGHCALPVVEIKFLANLLPNKYKFNKSLNFLPVCTKYITKPNVIELKI